MKKVILGENVRISAIKNFHGDGKMIDYYLTVPGQEKIYAFSRQYTTGTYEMCKAGIRVNALSTVRSHDRGVMNLVKYLNRMLPYLKDYYDLDGRAA